MRKKIKNQKRWFISYRPSSCSASNSVQLVGDIQILINKIQDGVKYGNYYIPDPSVKHAHGNVLFFKELE